MLLVIPPSELLSPTRKIRHGFAHCLFQVFKIHNSFVQFEMLLREFPSRQHNNLIVLLVSQKVIDEKTADEASPANNKRFTLHQNIPLNVIPLGAHAYRPTMRSSSSSIVRGQSSFNRRENARSARSLPPVWHRGQ